MNVAASAPVAWGVGKDKQILRRNQTSSTSSSILPHEPDESMHIASDDEDVQTNNADECGGVRNAKAPELSP
jgi:hypothetical protein